MSGDAEVSASPPGAVAAVGIRNSNGSQTPRGSGAIGRDGTGACANVGEQAPAAATVLSETADQKRESESPDTAVADMLRLYHAGESQQLILQLQAFIAKYPQYKLPDELQGFALKNGLVKSGAEQPATK